MGGTAVKGKADIMSTTKTTKIKSCSNLKSSSDSTKNLVTPKKYQSQGAVTSLKNTLNTGIDKSSLNPNSSRSNTKDLPPIQENSKAPRKDHKKVKANIIKNKTTIDASSELDVLKIVKKNNYDFDDNDLIDECLLKHFFMRCLEQDARMEIIKEMSLCKIDMNTYVFHQDSMGNFFYIIKEGECELFINNNYIKNLRAGDSFGELALLHGAPRSGSVKTVGIMFVWCLERRNFRKIVDHINFLNFEENKKFISSIPILCNIENEMKSVLASNLIKLYYDKDKVIVKEGDVSNCLYIIKEGEVDCIQNGRLIRTLKKGDHFGEKSILLESTRTLDVYGKTTCVIYSISIDTLNNMVGERYKDILYLNIIKVAFSKSNVFGKFNSKLIENAYECFKVKNFLKGDIVLRQGHQMSSKIIVIIEGSILNEKINQIIGKRGDILFENEIVKNKTEDKLKYDLIADPDCLIIEADKDVFMKFLGGTFKDIMKKSIALESLNKIPLFRNFSSKKMEILSSITNIEKFDNGKRIITQGETDSRFYIVKSGKVDIFIDNNYIRTLNKNEYFGERALFFKEPRTATAQANGTVECYYIDYKDFKLILEENLTNFLKSRFFLQDISIELKDLDYIRELGNGNFGSVCLVKSRKNKNVYAIKSMAKKQIDVDGLHKNIDLEKAILLKIDHPFIVKLVKTLKDSKNIYFLMEYIKGKELFDVIRDIGLLSPFQAQFYACSIMIAIDYLHERRFIYRDIKPENIMVSENGYLKLIDFGTVKEITDRTSTIIGTPHYMAPEVILGEGYTFSIDYWSIAICMYEFICGYVPFGESAEDPMQVYYAIINDDLHFPEEFRDKEFKNLMSMMITKNPLSRLTKLSHIKAHPWLLNFSWDNLISLDMIPPYVPKIKIKDEENNTAPYISYIKVNKIFFLFFKNQKEYGSSKDCITDKKLQAEYDLWFKNF